MLVFFVNQTLCYLWVINRIPVWNLDDIYTSLAVPCVTVVTDLSPCRPGFEPRPVHVGFMVDKRNSDMFFFQHFGFPLSASFHNCSKPILILILFLSEGKRGEVFEPSHKAMFTHHCNQQKHSYYTFFFCMARQPYMGLGLLVSSRFHDHTL